MLKAAADLGYGTPQQAPPPPYTNHNLVSPSKVGTTSVENPGSASCIHKFAVACLYQLLPPANEVCEGYVFTGVCLSTRGSRSLSKGSMSQGGVSVWGVSLSRGSLSRGGVSVQGGSLCPGGESLSRGSLSRGSLFRGISVRGSLYRKGSLSRGSLSRGVSVQGVSVQGVSVQGSLQGVSVGRSLSRGKVSVWPSLSGPPPIRLRTGSKHPTGIHSCLLDKMLFNCVHCKSRKTFLLELLLILGKASHYLYRILIFQFIMNYIRISRTFTFGG